MKIFFRIDDVNPGMDWEKFRRFISLMENYRIKPLLGVVPECRDPQLLVSPIRESFWQDIYQMYEEGYKIALHGYDHIYINRRKGIFPLTAKSEFAGVAFELQKQKIRNGLKIFECHGISTDIFMAPSHSFDKNTLRVLRENGFRYITDGYQRACYRMGGLIFIPIATGIHDIDSCRRKDFQSITITVHTNSMSKTLLSKYDNICEKNKYDLCSYENIAELKPLPYKYWEERGKLLSTKALNTILKISKSYKE